MKTKIVFALVAFLMLGSVNLNAQESGNPQSSESTTPLEGDLNHDNKVDVADVTYLVNIIMNKKSEAKDGVYYWYIGIDNPSIISDIQTDRTVAGWHEIGPSLSGFVLDTNTNKITISTSRVIYYVVIPNELHIYNGLNVNIESVDFTGDTCSISGYKAFRFVPEEGVSGVRTVQGPIIKQSI